MISETGEKTTGMNIGNCKL